MALTLQDFGGQFSPSTITFNVAELNARLEAAGLPKWDEPRDAIEPLLWVLLRLFYSTQIDFSQVSGVLFNQQDLQNQSRTLRVSRANLSPTLLSPSAISARELYTLQFNFVGANDLTDPDLL
ncbi:hypothetical protein FEK30_13245 [Picosynechococcus sp. PCC 11901]|uniref:hypothetical protein n=1 Tax=Picosynechococcus sp. PCC 11901 TaxID=2579791 RepID=UPI0010FBC772|nr:hypothetical protein [Picosynechococcus sp. PCC 11901]QCS50308.1 hypothetical protein FEK30_13245 [Picosynechococcus sp. PCC 11901]